MSKNKTLKANVYSSNCPSREVLDHVTSTWGALVLAVLIDETLRFGELRDKIGGISEKMLSQTLRTLEQDGFVDRKAYPVIPPKVEYSLTPLGKDVALKVAALTKWVEGHLPEVLRARQKAKP